MDTVSWGNVVDMHDPSIFHDFKCRGVESMSHDNKIRAITSHYISPNFSPGTIALATLIAERKKHDHLYVEFLPSWTNNEIKVEEMEVEETQFLQHLYLTAVPATRFLMSLIKHWEHDCKKRFIPLDALSFREFLENENNDNAICSNLVSNMKIVLDLVTVNPVKKSLKTHITMDFYMTVAEIVDYVLQGDDEEWSTLLGPVTREPSYSPRVSRALEQLTKNLHEPVDRNSWHQHTSPPNTAYSNWDWSCP